MRKREIKKEIEEQEAVSFCFFRENERKEKKKKKRKHF